MYKNFLCIQSVTPTSRKGSDASGFFGKLSDYYFFYYLRIAQILQWEDLYNIDQQPDHGSQQI